MATPLPALLEPPRRFARPGGVEDRYHSMFIIGRGGMGNVEVALERAPGGFERVVALKTLLPEGARDLRHKEMFLREARLAALLDHPNVVHAFAFGELYGELFLAMEYVEGEPLSRVLSAIVDEASAHRAVRGLDPSLVAFVLAEACDGLHAAHELRDTGGNPLHVVHRDVSPQNVMIAYEGHVKILDFGVAKFDTGGHQTRTGEVKGKMAYMSPEQALGEKIDRRSDLFSVGAVLFECLTGRRMWGSGTDLEVMRRLALEDPPRLDDAMSDAPLALVDLHARLVSRDPAGRPQTAHEVATGLRAFASARPAPDMQTVRTLMRRLFNAEQQRRRAQLMHALEEAAPARAAELRQRVESEANVDATSSTKAVIVRGSPSRGRLGEGADHGSKRSALAAAAALAVLVVVVGATVTAVAMRAASVGALQPQAAAAAAPLAIPSSSVAVPSATPPVVAAPASAASASSIPRVTPAKIAAPVAQPSKSRGAGGASAARARPRPDAKSSGSKLPDVDPTPF